MARNWCVVVISIFRYLLISSGLKPLSIGIFNNAWKFQFASLLGITFLFICSIPRLMDKFTLIEPLCEEKFQTFENCSVTIPKSTFLSNFSSKYIVFGLVHAEEPERFSFMNILSHGIISFLFQTQGPVIIIVSTNLIVLIRLSKHNRRISRRIAMRSYSQKYNNIRRANAERTILLVSLGFTILELPSFFNKIILFFCGDVHPKWLLQYSYLANFCTVCDSFFNFAIYIFANAEFRKAIWSSLTGRVIDSQNQQIKNLAIKNESPKQNVNDCQNLARNCAIELNSIEQCIEFVQNDLSSPNEYIERVNV